MSNLPKECANLRHLHMYGKAPLKTILATSAIVTAVQLASLYIEVLTHHIRGLAANQQAKAIDQVCVNDKTTCKHEMFSLELAS